jgi:hypothetical protein
MSARVESYSRMQPRIDNFRLYRHCLKEGEQAPTYVCHICGRETLKVEDLEPLLLPDPQGGGKSFVGPSNTCKICWAAFKKGEMSRTAEMERAPWPPAWSAALYEQAERDKAASEKPQSRKRKK